MKKSKTRSKQFGKKNMAVGDSEKKRKKKLFGKKREEK